jgi:hypothetical protein
MKWCYLNGGLKVSRSCRAVTNARKSSANDKYYAYALSEDNLNKRRVAYKRRLIVVYSPSKTHAQLMAFNKQVEDNMCEVNNRNMEYIHVKDSKFSIKYFRYDGAQVGSTYYTAVMSSGKTALQDMFDMTDNMYMRKNEMKYDHNCASKGANNFRVQLLGYDGKVKSQYTSAELQKMFDKIDTMYYRKQEMKDDADCNA